MSVRGLLTYFEHNPARRCCAFRYIHRARVGWINHDGEDLAWQPDRIAMVILGFPCSTTGFSN
jgi:hypothetical protein